MNITVGAVRQSDGVFHSEKGQNQIYIENNINLMFVSVLCDGWRQDLQL